MNKDQAIRLLDSYKERLSHHVDWLLVDLLEAIIKQITDDEWKTLLEKVQRFRTFNPGLPHDLPRATMASASKRHTIERSTMSSRNFDREGREYARADAVKEGTVLIADGGFTCMEKGSSHVVEVDDEGPYVRCRYGRHHLDGQVTMDETHYLGLYLG